MQVPFAGAFEKVGSGVGRVWNPISQRLGRRGTIVLRYVTIVIVAIVVFLFALQATFPYDRVKDRAIEELSAGWEVSIGGVERGIIPGNVTFTDVSLKSRASRPEDVMQIFIKQADVKMGILPLLGLRASVDLKLKIGNPAGYGYLTGNLSFPRFGAGGIKIALTGDELPGASLPMRSVISLPVTGKIDVKLDLDLPNTKSKTGKVFRDWTKADGEIDISCPSGCTLGDGKTKLKPLVKDRSRQAMVGEGIDFDKLNITTLAIKAKFTPAEGDPDAHSSAYKPGKFEVTQFELKSPDGEVHVEYQMTMATTLDESMVAGCLKFKPDESLKLRPEGLKMYTTITSTGAEKRADGLFHIKLSDKFKDMKRLNADCGAGSPASTVGNGENFNPSVGSAQRPPAPNMGAFANRPAINPGSATPTTPPPPPPQTEPMTGSAGSAHGSAGSAGSGFGSAHEGSAIHADGSAVPNDPNLAPAPPPEGGAAGAGAPPPNGDQPSR
ncbi:MAG TPA: type II secretion system protein GspN [Kofleriaceae bacterium]